MEVCRNIQQFNRIPLPSIQGAYKNCKSDHRFHSVDQRNYDLGHENLKPNDNESSGSEELCLENTSDVDLPSISRGSINDAPTTCDTSKNSLQRKNEVSNLIKKPSIQKESQRGRRAQSRKLKSETGSMVGDNQSAGNSSPFGKTGAGFNKYVPKEYKPPKVSSKCWAIMDGKTGDLIASKKGNKKREIASLTKMMTCICVCKLIKQYNIAPKSIYIQVSKLAASMGGTSADLQRKDVVSIWDLMHALMLPSGNDAAISLAESFGTYIYLKSDKCKQRTKVDPTHPTQKVKNAIKYFLNLMNKTAIELGLKNTYYANPHGLINTESYSTAVDQAKLTQHVLKWDLAREIVNKKEYICEVEEGDGTIRTVKWENTNKLLGRKGWYGVKTGVTTAAGPSLSAYYEHENESYILILLGSASMDIRWIESIRLVEWANKHKDEKNIIF